MKIKHLQSITFVIFFIFLLSCKQDYVPKPRGYPRIDMPENKYQLFDTIYPYSFEYSVYSVLVPDNSPGAEPYWINIEYPSIKSSIHISYKTIKNNLANYTEDTRKFAMKHIPKASNINEKYFSMPEKNVHGIVYEIGGTAAASTYQFYVTDSTRHFVRGALYFNMIPNNDSLAPEIDFVKKDIDHFINTIHWK